MSNKLSSKPSKRDRPKSTDKSKGKKQIAGTPEKAGSPVASAIAVQDEALSGSLNGKVISGDDVESLAINLDELKKTRPPKKPEVAKPSTKVVVRKARIKTDTGQSAGKSITVAKPAPLDFPLVSTPLTGSAGPVFDADGQVLTHSILGTWEDFYQEAMARGDIENLPPFSGSFVHAKEVRPFSDSPKKTKRSHPNHVWQTRINESNALNNWQQQMLQRKRQQNHLSALLQTSTDMLVMNQSEDYRKNQEQRHVIDRAIPSVDYGKGYQVGSEFWKQVEQIGNDETGITMTLTQTERGYPPPIEHISKPITIKNEMGIEWSSTHRKAAVHYPWQASGFLQERKEQLNSVMNEIDPHQPYMDELEVVGGRELPHQSKHAMSTVPEEEEPMAEQSPHLRDPLASYADVIPQPIFGPSLTIDGQTAQWTGSSTNGLGRVGVASRVTFEANTGERVVSLLHICNDGTTAIYFSWKRVPKANTLGTKLAGRTQRFYFDTNSRVILPGETLKFPFIFKSLNAGIFSENWELLTEPVLCGGGAIRVCLRGIAIEEDVYADARREIEKELAHREAIEAAARILQEILDGVRTPERSRSPVDAYITEEEIFSRQNKGMHFQDEAVQSLKEIFVEVEPGAEWDLSVGGLQQRIMVVEDDDTRDSLLQRLNQAIVSLSFPPPTPMKQAMYTATLQVLCEMVDNIVGQAVMIRSILGLPQRDLVEDISQEEVEKRTRKPTIQEPKPDSKKSDRKDKKGKDKGADHERPTSTQRSKLSAKKSGRGTATPSSQPKSALSEAADRALTPASGDGLPVEKVDPVIEAKYREKLFIQAYGTIVETFTKLDMVLGDIRALETSEASE
ncbi:MYCBP-associated protein [Nematostella vectensis]|uniref:MYCBP-associated protein n=1 Tax=Nematostella vectensis TaxID=45351 RepID=UPI002077876A|nr:MYCBP-associated protein [Nematostella vectensis]